eukprot:g26243.t1
MHGYETQFGFAAVALCLLPGVLGQGQTVPCIDDCLAEALASVPTKGCAAGTYWRPYPESSPVDSCQPCPLGAYCPGIAYGNFTEHPVKLGLSTWGGLRYFMIFHLTCGNPDSCHVKH